MSATIRKEWLNTVDFKPSDEPPLSLSDADKEFEPLKNRLNAVKNLAKASFEPDAKGKEEAKLAVEKHRRGTRTLIVVNTVNRAQHIFNELDKIKKASDNQAELVLLHSRFRPPERAEALQRLLDEPPSGGTIAVCTQVVEAGVDVSAATLITDLAPWPSLVQRFGRCNRTGEFENSDIYWIDVPDNSALPYSPEELIARVNYLKTLQMRVRLCCRVLRTICFLLM
jgi:CRISPR-associated endonuclease/helicase Cas3